jgi:hypothetical protein
LTRVADDALHTARLQQQQPRTNKADARAHCWRCRCGLREWQWNPTYHVESWTRHCFFVAGLIPFHLTRYSNTFFSLVHPGALRLLPLLARNTPSYGDCCARFVLYGPGRRHPRHRAREALALTRSPSPSSTPSHRQPRPCASVSPCLGQQW